MYLPGDEGGDGELVMDTSVYLCHTEVWISKERGANKEHMLETASPFQFPACVLTTVVVVFAYFFFDSSLSSGRACRLT